MSGQLALLLAGREHAADVGRMIDAMDAHYNGEGRTKGAALAAAMAARTITDGEGTRFLLARIGGEPVGLACFVVVRPGHRLQGVLFVKDLYTVPAARGQGVGTALMRELARYALGHGIGRIDLTTDESNAGARRLYERLGAATQPKVMFRFDEARLSELAGVSR